MALSTRNTPSRPVISATRARQGRFGRHIVWVLLLGTLLAALALFAAWTWRAGDLQSTENSDASRAADAQSFNAPEPAAVNPPPELKEGSPPPAPVG